jgi:hypothetical protein
MNKGLTLKTSSIKSQNCESTLLQTNNCPNVSCMVPFATHVFDTRMEHRGLIGTPQLISLELLGQLLKEVSWSLGMWSRALSSESVQIEFTLDSSGPRYLRWAALASYAEIRFDICKFPYQQTVTTSQLGIKCANSPHCTNLGNNQACSCSSCSSKLEHVITSTHTSLPFMDVGSYGPPWV